MGPFSGPPPGSQLQNVVPQVFRVDFAPFMPPYRPGLGDAFPLPFQHRQPAPGLLGALAVKP
jgi:hypothetical protein